MPANAGTAYVEIVPDTKAFASKLQRGLGPSLQTVGRSLSSVGGTLTKTVTLPIVGLGVAAVKAFSEAQKATAQTEAVIKSTGGAANVTRSHVLDLASTVRDYSGIEDETVQAGENMLLTFTNIRNEQGRGNAVFDDATKILADMSTALGQDMSSSAIQLGKALNDPIKGITALRRVGVAFTQQQQDQITALVQSGHTMEAQKLILRELTKEFGGSARAMGQTAEGQMRIALSHLGDVGEQLGAIFVPLINKFSDWAERLAHWFRELDPAERKQIVLIAAIAAAVGPLLIVVGKLTSGLGALIRVLPIFGGPWGLAIAVLGALAALWLSNDDNRAAFLKGIGDFVSYLQRTFGPIVQQIITRAKQFWDNYGDDILRILGVVVDYFKRYFVNSLKILFNAVALILDILTGHWGDAWNKIKGIVGAIWDQIKTIVSFGVNLIKTIILTAWHVIQRASSAVWNGIKSVVGNVLATLVRGFSDFLQFFLFGFVRMFLHGIASAFGWVPFVGGRLKAARDAFDNWADGVLSRLRSTADGFDRWGRQVGGDLDSVSPHLANLIAQMNTLIQKEGQLAAGRIIGGGGEVSPQRRPPPAQFGGIVTRPTVVLAGEAGPEAIIPLNRMRRSEGGAMRVRSGRIEIMLGGRVLQGIVRDIVIDELDDREQFVEALARRD